MPLLLFLRRLKKPSYAIRQVSGNSMLPTYRPGRIIVCHRQATYGLGDVVIIGREGREEIKRIVRLRGSNVWVEGDNVAGSTDSRFFGWLPVSAIRAKVVWPNY